MSNIEYYKMLIILLCNKIYYRGTVFTLSYYSEELITDTFMLVECFSGDCVFQILRIAGLNSGEFVGYVPKGILKGTHRAVTRKELIRAIKHNFNKPVLRSLKFIDIYNLTFSASKTFATGDSNKECILGSIFNVKYKYDGRKNEEKFILARSDMPERLFQIIIVYDYYAGTIAGYISYQFDNVLSCSFEHLKKELEICVYGKVLELDKVR